MCSASIFLKNCITFAPNQRYMRAVFGFVALLMTVVVIFGACMDDGKGRLDLRAVDDSSFQYVRDGQTWSLRLESESDSLYKIVHLEGDSLVDELVLRNEVYRFDCGDLTGDGLPEIVVGVTKPTRYRPQNDRRLFIYHLYDGRFIRPLWLGSRLGGKLLDFSVVRNSVPALVRSLEMDGDSNEVERTYQYEGFGLKFVSETYIKSNH